MADALDTIQEFGIPAWFIALAIAGAAAFFIYRNVRETQLIELQLKKLKNELGEK